MKATPEKIERIVNQIIALKVDSSYRDWQVENALTNAINQLRLAASILKQIEESQEENVNKNSRVIRIGVHTTRRLQRFADDNGIAIDRPRDFNQAIEKLIDTHDALSTDELKE